MLAPGLALVVHGADALRVEPGWVAPSYGRKLAAPVISAAVDGRAEATFVTILAPREPDEPPPRVTCLGDGEARDAAADRRSRRRRGVGHDRAARRELHLAADVEVRRTVAGAERRAVSAQLLAPDAAVPHRDVLLDDARRRGGCWRPTAASACTRSTRSATACAWSTRSAAGTGAITSRCARSRPGRAARRSRTSAGDAVHLPELDAVAWTFPNDRKLSTLSLLAGRSAALDRLVGRPVARPGWSGTPPSDRRPRSASTPPAASSPTPRSWPTARPRSSAARSRPRPPAATRTCGCRT